MKETNSSFDVSSEKSIEKVIENYLDICYKMEKSILIFKENLKQASLKLK